MEEPKEMERVRKNQERERRRLRDRERRQSMSQEERERHLARRRRNYQLRRQRAEIARLDSQIQLFAGNHETPLTSSPDSDRNQSLDIPLHELAKLTGSIRLTRLKHVARALCNSSSNLSIACNRTSDMTAKTRCAMSSGLRLTRFKWLARSCRSSNTSSQGLEVLTQMRDGEANVQP
ncbi:PREDICTED: uncharacterized protein LOC104814480 [Tarenaya hassleriana]|uniref:uncharacterized protein LOC104814480 n=1 Tax=Tarenaya hassleriana TaxID=28532 RepID=UPI00053C3468|nr:PREDICTED: uncharacterized protein LOC104814480 [Tarenaya hassleriana]XP_010540837.1 PREDICTED: uncharacterized protein LOC104814480 [Tarenaya hassleriana]XP_010540838.1 PREDICTED: uncharacterized protein LOC104814480 [Tarenaya hassleriana]XP_010540839.1 PREDICTED: uncharacterized protein LOC104814480 [Tarenaya hassleriana]